MTLAGLAQLGDRGSSGDACLEGTGKDGVRVHSDTFACAPASTNGQYLPSPTNLEADPSMSFASPSLSRLIGITYNSVSLPPSPPSSTLLTMELPP